MKLVTVLVSAVLVLGLTGLAHAAVMIAGPLNANTSCSCLIMNASTGTKTIFVQLMNKGGIEIKSLGPEPLDGGEGNGVSESASSLVYCKFTVALPSSFRASIICDGVALPAK